MSTMKRDYYNSSLHNDRSDEDYSCGGDGVVVDDDDNVDDDDDNVQDDCGGRGVYVHTSASNNQPQLIACVLPMSRVHSKK